MDLSVKLFLGQVRVAREIDFVDKVFWNWMNEALGCLLGVCGVEMNLRPSPIILVMDLWMSVSGLLMLCIPIFDGQEK